jgi:hypothetical protein
MAVLERGGGLYLPSDAEHVGGGVQVKGDGH